MITYRKARPEDRAKYIDFINMVFSMTWIPHNFKTLLPKVYADGRETDDMQNIAVDEAGNIRALIAVLPGTMHVGGQVLRTGYVGTVSVHPFARGEGHMKALMRMAIDGAKADGVDLMLLGGQRQRYEYFGFTPGGVETRYEIRQANVRHALKDVDTSGLTFAPLEDAAEGLVDAAFALHESQPVRMDRPRPDFVCILQSYGQKPFAVLRNGEFAGYLAASAELDEFSEIVLCDPSLYPAVVKGWMTAQNTARLRVAAAAYDVELNRAIAAFAEEERLGNAEQLRVLNWPRVLRALLPLSGAVRPLQDGALSLWIDGQPLTITAQNGAVTVETCAPEDAPRLTGNQAQRRLFSFFAGFDGPLAPAGWLPLRLRMNPADHF